MQVISRGWSSLEWLRSRAVKICVLFLVAILLAAAASCRPFRGGSPAGIAPSVAANRGAAARVAGCYRLAAGPWDTDSASHAGLSPILRLQLTVDTVYAGAGRYIEVFAVRDGDGNRTPDLEIWYPASASGDSIVVTGRGLRSGYTLRASRSATGFSGLMSYVMDLGPRASRAPAQMTRIDCSPG